VEQLFFHWTDFHKILYLSIFRKPVENFNIVHCNYITDVIFNTNLLNSEKALFWAIAQRVVVIPGFLDMKKVKTYVWTQQITSLPTLYDYISYKMILRILIFQFSL